MNSFTISLVWHYFISSLMFYIYFITVSDEFALHYVKTLVIPGAMERYRVEQDREKTNGKVWHCHKLSCDSGE